MTKRKSIDLSIDWVKDCIQNISFFSPVNCKKFEKRISKKLDSDKLKISDLDRNLFDLFKLKLRYYKQSLNEDEENKVWKIVYFFEENDQPILSSIGILFICRLYLNTKRIEQVDTLLKNLETRILELDNTRIRLEFLYMKSLLYYYQGKYNLSSRVVFEAMALPVNSNDETQFGFLRYFDIIHASIYLNLGMYQESLRIAHKGLKEIQKKYIRGTLYFLHFNCVSLNLLNLKKYNFLEKYILTHWQKIEEENNLMYKRFHRSILNKIYIQSDQFEKVLPIFPKMRNEVLSNYSLLEYEVEKYYIDFILTKKKTNYSRLKKLEEQANQFTENFKITYYKCLIHLAEHFGDIRTAHRAYAKRVEIEEKVNSEKAKNLVTGFHIKYEFESLKKQIKEVEEKAKIKHEFLVGISHDLRSPLAAVISATNLLGNTALHEEQRNEYIKTAKNSATGLIAMIEELLEVSSIESRTVTIHQREIFIRDILNLIVESHRLLAEEKKLKFELNIDELKINHIYSDSNLIQRIISNLLTNAIKYTERGSVILKVHNDSSWLIVECSDTGRGIEEEKINTIFDLYSKSNSEFSHRKDSHGVGLFIVKNLTTALGGIVEVTSDLGSGSTFSIHLPITRIH